MRQKINDHRVFWREFRRNFATTGSIMPSGRALAMALTRYLDPKTPQRILEVGPGTGAVTQQIVGRMGPHDELLLVEANEAFVKQLNERFSSDPVFSKVADRCKIVHKQIEQLPPSDRYDVVVSGLPLNNFQPSVVQEILAGLRLHLAEGGTISFFQYFALRHARALISNRLQRQRLRDIGQVLQKVLDEGEVAREVVWSNFPPATVHHLQYSSTPPNTPPRPSQAPPIDEHAPSR